MSQFNLRKKPRLSYYEIEEPNMDEYIYCSDCRDYVFEYCSIHGPLLVIPDNKVPTKTNFPSYVPRAALTIPDVFLHLAPSTIPDAGLGVFTTLTLPENVRFGPYRGKISHNAISNYCWQIYDKNNRPSHVIDASNANKSNWMRYVNCSRNWHEQNLVAFQYRGQIYYRTTKIIPCFTELMVFYGIEFANKLNIDLRRYNKPLQPAESQTIAVENIKEELGVIEIDNKNSLNPNIDSVNSDCEPTNILPNKSELKKKIKRRQNKIKKINEREVTKNTNTTVDNNNNNSVESSGIMESRKLNDNETQQATNNEVSEGRNNEIESVYPINHNMFSCDQCLYKGITRYKTSHIQMHFIASTGTKVYPCDICYFICPNKESLEKHKKCHCGKYNCSPYKCNICNKAFIRNYALTYHMRIHSGQKPYKCNICNKAFIQKSNLTTHTRTHTDEKPYKCDVCNKAFKQKSDLTNHTRIHTGEKPYKCDICNKAFILNGNLSKHMRTHTGEKPYKCNICNKAFIQKSYLTIHMRIHTGEKPYKCNICNKAFIRNSVLTSHARIHTGEKHYKCDTK